MCRRKDYENAAEKEEYPQLKLLYMDSVSVIQECIDIITAHNTSLKKENLYDQDNFKLDSQKPEIHE